MIVQDSVLTNWLAKARQGETLVYARATALPVGSRVAQRLRLLSESGHVLLYRERRHHGPGDENFRYIARRTAKPMPTPDMAGARPVVGIRPLEAIKPQDRRFGSRAAVVREIAPELRSMIAEGAPINAEAMARTLGVYSVDPVRRALQEIGRLAA